MLTLAQGQRECPCTQLILGFLLVTLGYQPYCPVSCSCSSPVAMSAPSTNPAGILPIADAASVPVPTQSDQDMSEVHGPIIRTADLRTGIVSSSQLQLVKVEGTIQRERMYLCCCSRIIWQMWQLFISMAYLLKPLGMLSQGTDRSLIVWA